MPIKIENLARTKLPRQTESDIEKALGLLPREHLRGIDRLRLVDAINDPRLRGLPTPLPGLYHPRQGSQLAWIEIAVGTLLPQSSAFHKRLLPRLSFKNNLVALVFSLIGQHYYLTLRHSVKKGQLETAVRAYTEKYLRAFSEKEHTLRARIFRPLQPTLERWARSLHRRGATKRNA